MPAKAGAELIELNAYFNDTGTDSRLRHEVGGHEGYIDGEDTQLNPQNSPAVDFYSTPLHSQTKLVDDVRGLQSTSTYHTQMMGRGLPVTEPTTGYLSFWVSGATDFGGKPILADVYEINTDVGIVSEMRNINVREYGEHYDDPAYQIPLSFAGDKTIYNIDIRFVPEPGTSILLCIGSGVATLIWWRRR